VVGLQRGVENDENERVADRPVKNEPPDEMPMKIDTSKPHCYCNQPYDPSK
jgi:hypothetical protein